MPENKTEIIIGNIFLVFLAIIIVVIFIGPIILPTGLDDRRNKVPTVKAQINAIENLIIQYYADTGYYPSTSEGLKALMERPAGPTGSKWNGPYAKKPRFTDGWGRELQYLCPGTHHPDAYDIWSNGADGKPAGTGKNADVGNWK